MESVTVAGEVGGTGSLQVAEEVADALDDDRPVVALESTLVSHGLERKPRYERPGRFRPPWLSSMGRSRWGCQPANWSA